MFVGCDGTLLYILAVIVVGIIDVGLALFSIADGFALRHRCRSIYLPWPVRWWPRLFCKVFSTRRAENHIRNCSNSLIYSILFSLFITPGRRSSSLRMNSPARTTAPKQYQPRCAA